MARVSDGARELPLASLAEASAVVERLLTVAQSSLERQSQLERALATRVVVEQAKGVLAERFGLGVDAAFELLRSAARSNRVTVRDLAELVVSSRQTPAQITAEAGDADDGRA